LGVENGPSPLGTLSSGLYNSLYYRTSHDLEFADDVVLLSHSFNHMQEKTHCLEATAGSVELRINKDKSTIMKMMTDCLQTVSLTKGIFDEVEEFTHLGSVVSTRRH